MRIVLLLCLGLSLIAWSQNPDSADTYLKNKDYKNALREYRLILDKNPDIPPMVWGAGISASRLNDYPSARDYFLHYRKLTPDDSAALVELIRAYQGLNDSAAVDASIKEYKAWWKSGRDAKLSKEDSFIRFVTSCGKHKVYAFEFFAPDLKKRDHTWDFMIYPAAGGEAEAMFYMMQDGQQWFLDLRSGEGGRTLTTFDYLPGFEECLGLVETTLAGGKPPIVKLKNGTVVPRK